MNEIRRACTFALAALTLAASGCASIVTGQNQPISVQARSGPYPVSGAECTLTNDKGQWFVSTPGSVMVSRSYEELHVSCARDGYEPGITAVKSATKGMAFGNIIAGGLIGAAVDAGSGAAYDYPPVITVRMTRLVTDAPPPASSAPATLAADAPPAPAPALAPPAARPASAAAPSPPARPPAPAAFPKGFVIMGPH